MKYSYINLETAADRRRFVEENFRSNSHSEKTITRVEAVDVAHVISTNVPGPIRPTEKACYLSHLKALQAAKAFSDDIFIAEDDVLFCEDSTKIIEGTVAGLTAQDWDIVFSDVCIPDIHTMVDLFLARRQLAAAKQIQLYRLSELPFAGATAYVVNNESKDKLLGLLSGPALDAPYDLALRQLVYDKKITALVTFPFATSLSDFAENTQIQPENSLVTDLVWNAFRRLVWRGRDLNTVSDAIGRIDAGFYDRDAEVFSRILNALLSSNLKIK